MKFEWLQIWEQSSHDSACFQETYRAKVYGGWLVRHETGSNYQYPHGVDEQTPDGQYILEEGYQDIKNVMNFISDPEHKWEIE